MGVLVGGRGGKEGIPSLALSPRGALGVSVSLTLLFYAVTLLPPPHTPLSLALGVILVTFQYLAYSFKMVAVLDLHQIILI